ncbi:BURP domain-containing protein 15 [Dichanthelium oligosanthes]|uniref:BURP domain-containing protein 15 n=1 Tax=Dichanthelium oligosanthes TaxID=888268 RepID=A0A1E5WIZ5_9POAL|nr:BURP domain-containing protein 15 [Dichanthelium oligosanthes]
MACLVLLLVAAAVLTAPPGRLTHAAPTPSSSPEAFWRAALPGAPMPESIRELLRRPSAEVNAPTAGDEDVRGDDPPPPMNFNYDDYRASPESRDQVATAGPPAKAPEHLGDARKAGTAPTVFFLEDAVRVGGSLPFRRAANDEASHPLELYTVRAVRAVEGSSFVVCHRDAAGSDGGGGAVYGCRGVSPARAYAVDVAAEYGGGAVTATVVCHTADDTSMWYPARAALGLIDVKKPGGEGEAVVCHAVIGAQVLPVKNDESPSSA